jgi:hypothetical protein
VFIFSQRWIMDEPITLQTSIERTQQAVELDVLIFMNPVCAVSNSFFCWLVIKQRQQCLNSNLVTKMAVAVESFAEGRRSSETQSC